MTAPTKPEVRLELARYISAKAFYVYQGTEEMGMIWRTGTGRWRASREYPYDIWQHYATRQEAKSALLGEVGK